MTMDQLIVPLVSAILGGLIGGGAIAGLFYRALKDRLREDLAEAFAPRADMHGLEDRVQTLATTSQIASEQSMRNAERLTRLEEAGNADRASFMATLKRIDRTLEKIEQRYEAQQTEITRTVTMLAQLEKRMDRQVR